jgi:hypothetical protein
MKMNHIKQALLTLFILGALSLTACRTGTAPAGSGTDSRSLSPQRVDIRGSIIATRYSDGQVILEVEALAPSADSRYNRAYVLVTPTAQMVDTDGQPISISELFQGQKVAILLRGGGQGNLVGVGVARKLWIEEGY